MVSRIEQLIKSKNTTITAVEKELNFSRGSIKKWDISAPSIDKFYKLAQYLNVSCEFLLTGKDFDSQDLDLYENFLLEVFRNINEKGKEYLISSAKMVCNEYKKDISVSSTETA